MTHVLHATDSGLLYAGLEAGGTKCVCAVGRGLTTYARAYSLRRRHRLRPWHALWPF